MSDELTPEEKAAFESLPRERMPAGLEAKVVDAMRDHGFLAKRRRVIELSRGRVAGVLAASVALVIVGYSLGLHRGEGRKLLVPSETVTTAEPEIKKYPAELGVPLATSGSDKDRKSESPAPEIGRAAQTNEPATDAASPSEERQALKKEAAPAPATAPASRRDEYVAPQSEVPARASEMDLRANRIGDELTRSVQEPKQRVKSSLQSTAPTPAPSASMGAYSLSKPKEAVTLLWGGDAYSIEADSVRVVGDESGRTLHIYTSQGIIRIRLAE